MNGFLVIRTYWNYNDQQSNSQELKATFDEARKRMFTILGTDIGKDSIQFEIVTILDARTGLQMEKEIVDNRPEPEPEQGGED